MGFPVGLARKGPEAGQYTENDAPRSPQIARLAPHHEHMARLVACGAKPQDLAYVTGFSSGQITRIVNSQLFRAAVARLTGEIEEHSVYNVRQELEQLACRSVEIVSEDLERVPESHAERVQRSRVAFEVLDRAGYGKKETGSTSLHLHKHEHVDVSKLATEDLLSDVLELSNG